MFLFIRSFIIDFTDLLFPNCCLGCKQSLTANEKILCLQCQIGLPTTDQHHQPYDVNVLNKFAGRVPIRFLSSYLYFTKGSIVQKLIHEIKYKGQKEAAKEIANWYGHQLKIENSFFQEIDLILGVPLHKSRMQQRGYNQADWIAEGLSDALGVPTQTDVLVRNQFKGSQTRKNQLERWENVEKAFSVVSREKIENKNIVIVDDVLTTGATVEACAIELIKAGCKSVSIVTLAATGQ